MKEFRKALTVSIPVMAGYVFLGITYGILMVTNGFPAWLPVITAAVIYTGSMEFLLTSILLSSFHPASAFATAVMVGARHLFYGIAMLPKYQGTGKVKPYLIYTTSDETFALNYNAEIPKGMNRTRYYTWVSFLDQSYWVTGSALGGFFGTLIHANTQGLDFVMTAMFLSIFMDQWMKDSDGGSPFWKAHGSELLGVAASILCLAVFGPDRFIIPAMVLILAVLTVYWKKRKEMPEA